MFEQAFRNIDDILHKDAGCGSELDYVEQSSWILFLKYLDDLESERRSSAELTMSTYTPLIVPEFQWNTWAVPKTPDGKIDHHTAKIGEDLIDFVNHELFPYFKNFRHDAEHADTIEYKIGEIFSEIKNRITSGYNLREVLGIVDTLHFQSSIEKHELSHLYEARIQKMGNAGRNGGEYYTPRPLIRSIIQVLDPQIGETIYDGACGSAGFLCEAFTYLDEKFPNRSTKDDDILQKKTFYGKEVKSLAYIIATMNMILHGVEAPNLRHMNTLGENINNFEEKDRHDIILANPPFGGKIRSEIQQNFPIKTGETAFLFLQHFIKTLRAGGRAGIVIKNTFLSNTDNASVALRRHLLESCELHTILDLPGGTFTGAGVKTVVLFFKKGAPTEKIWYYSLNLDRNLGKTNPLSERDLAEFVALQQTQGTSENSWTLDVGSIDTATYDLSVKNPNKKDEVALRSPLQIITDMEELDEETREVMEKLKNILSK